MNEVIETKKGKNYGGVDGHSISLSETSGVAARAIWTGNWGAPLPLPLSLMREVLLHRKE
jgi:hypothetical protein